MGQGAMGIGILRWRQEMRRWENYSVWLHKGSRQESGQGQVQSLPPRTEIRRRAEKGGAG